MELSQYHTQNGDLMIYIGIDITKLNHFASAISSDGEIVLQPFKFTNDYDSFPLLVQKLDSIDSDSIHHRS